MPHKFNQVYYPYLGNGTGGAYDASSFQPLDSVLITCFATGRVSGDTLIITRKNTDSLGMYHFGAWAGNRETDSTFYWITAHKESYSSDTVSGWIYRQELTTFPDLMLNNIGIEESSALLPSIFSSSCEPNPFYSKVTFHYKLPARASLSVKVHDIIGREVKSLVDDEFPSGVYEVEWDGKDKTGKHVPPGVYFYHFTTEAVSITRKIILLK